jgi:hypothetical protein
MPPFANDMLAQMGPAEWLAVGSAIAAGWSFLLNRATVKRQEIMQLEALRSARDTDLIAWAHETIERLADTQRLCRDRRDGLIDEEEFLSRRSEMRARLSAALDRGRLFFPNAPKDDDDPDKHAAFKGKRQPALDAVFGAYRTLSDIGRDGGPDPTAALEAVVAHRRLFVSEVFVSIDPRRRRDVLAALER